MKKLFLILLVALLLSSCTQEEDLILSSDVSFIEHYKSGSFERTEALKISEGENYIKGKDSTQMKVSLVIEDENMYVGKSYQLTGNDELARIYFNKGNYLQFASEGTLTVTKIENSKVEGIYIVSKAVNIYYTEYGFHTDSTGVDYSFNLNSGKFLFNK